MAQRIKVVIIGDKETGKTTYIRRHLTGQFTHKYIPTLGVEVTPLSFSTNKGKIILDIWDCADSMETSYWVGAQAFVIFFDLTKPQSYENAKMLAQKVKNETEAKIIICGSKVDLLGRRVLSKNIRLEHTYYDISAKSNYNYEKPLLDIIRHTLGHDVNFSE